MPARVLVAYAVSTGFTARHAADVAAEIAAVGELDVDVQPIAHVASIAPYVAVYLGWSGHSRAGQAELTRFLDRNAGLLGARKIWVVQRQPAGDGATVPAHGVLRLSRLLVRQGVDAERYPVGRGAQARPVVLPAPAPAPGAAVEAKPLAGSASA